MDVRRIDVRKTRYRDSRDATMQWFAHHFEWRRDAQGRERLQARAGAAPLPWQGWRERQRDAASYRFAPVAPEMLDVLRALAQRLGAQPVADSDQLRFPDCQGAIDFFGRSREDGAFEVSVYTPLSATGEAPCVQGIERIADAFDAELSSGRHDTLFRH